MTKRLAVLLVATVMWMGPSPPGGVPYSGLTHAEAKPSKPCGPENDGEEVVDIEGKWRCQGDRHEWKFIDPITPQPPLAGTPGASVR